VVEEEDIPRSKEGQAEEMLGEEERLQQGPKKMHTLRKRLPIMIREVSTRPM
jgi:hypothetical protein